MLCQFTTPVAPVQAFARPRTAVLARAPKARPGLVRCGVGLRPRAIPPEIKTALAHEHAQFASHP